ncbi:M56 family metallopeptidase [Aquimarina hainanensis]|uniref:M56 family metallopeptidase n=1 Tax=Aquimarina hainanensis TaxID=1578017 RepID=A0ABW5N359_9FLAO
MILYVLKSTLCLLLFWGFYMLFLEKEKIHRYKRWYLLVTIFIAYIIPLITISYTVSDVETTQLIQETPVGETKVEEGYQEGTEELVRLLIWSIYIVGVLIFGTRCIRNLWHLQQQIRHSEKRNDSTFISVLVDRKILPFTFLRYVFFSKEAYVNQEIPKEIILHEETHVRQRHTVDILFVEMFQVIFWFNPLWFWVKRAMKLNHEFLADQAVIDRQTSVQEYQQLLINYPISFNHTAIMSEINYSLTKKRLQMMKTSFSKRRAVLRLLMMIPIMGISMTLFNYQETIASDPFAPVVKQGKKTLHSEELQGVTAEMIARYNKWAKNIRKAQEKGRRVIIKSEELKEMRRIYGQMSEEQKRQAIPFPDVPPPPPPPLVRKGEVTAKMVSSFNRWAKKINKRIEERQRIILKEKETNYMKMIYNAMTKEQKEKSEAFPNIPPPPPPPKI